MLLPNQNGKKQYTFMVDHPDDSELVFHNVVITDWDGYKKTVLVTYEMSEDFVAKFTEDSVGFDNFTGNVTYELMTADEGYPCGETPGGSIPISGGYGPGVGGGSGPGGGGSGGNYGTGSPWNPNGNGNPFNQDAVDNRFLWMAIQYISAQFNQPLYAHQSPRNIGEIDRVTRGPNSFIPAIDDTTNPCGGDDEIGILLPIQILLDQTFTNNDCLKGVYDELGGSPTFQQYLNNFDGDFSVAHLKLSAGVIFGMPYGYAYTYPPLENNIIEIKVNTNKLNRPNLDVARTLIHEMIHAEIFRKLLIAAETGNLNIDNWTQAQKVNYINNLKDNFNELYVYYFKYQWNIPHGQQPSSPQHELMASNYRQTIIEVMKEYDNSLSDEMYEALSWQGLMGEGNPDDMDMTTGLPTVPTVAWSAVPQAERLNIINKIQDYKASNPPCQQ